MGKKEGAFQSDSHASHQITYRSNELQTVITYMGKEINIRFTYL